MLPDKILSTLMFLCLATPSSRSEFYESTERSLKTFFLHWNFESFFYFGRYILYDVFVFDMESSPYFQRTLRIDSENPQFTDGKYFQYMSCSR